MRMPGSTACAFALPSFLLPLLASATGVYDCHLILQEGIKFDISELGGARSAVHNEILDLSTTNTTYTINVCRPLGKVKGNKAEEQCPNGSRSKYDFFSLDQLANSATVCAITRSAANGEASFIESVTPIAGDLTLQGGGNLDAKFTRLKTSSSAGDVGKEGLRLEMNGGFKTINKQKRKQKAIIEFICDKERSGLENLPSSEDQYDEMKENWAKNKREENNTTTPSLEFFNYVPDADDTMDILRLNWRTRYACEDYKEQKDAEKSVRWGFFTWFIIM
jgi:hypothetical protein